MRHRGLKPTFGLVPYTGIGLLEITIDTAGPMTANVRDNALLLEVIAGPDGLDTRQRGVQAGRYTEALDGGVKGMRIAVIKEGFGHPNSEPDVDAHVRDAAQRFAKLGATVEEVSVPTHALGFPVWAAIRGDAACIMLLEMNGAGIGHEGLYVTSLLDHAMGWRNRADEFADTLKIASIFSRYTMDRYGGHFYAKAQNLRRRVRAGYDAVLATHDLLLHADGADESDADPRQGRDPAGDHAAQLGADPQHLPDQRHRPPGDQPAMRNGGRPADRDDADRASLCRGDDLSRGRGVRALRRLEDVLTDHTAVSFKALRSCAESIAALDRFWLRSAAD